MSTAEKIYFILNCLKTLTLVEASELVKAIEKTFNVKATNINFVQKPELEPKNTVMIEEKTEFDISLDAISIPDRIKVIKLVRKLTDMGVKEAKELVDACPTTLKQTLTKEKAEDFKKQFEEIGIVVKIV